METTNWLPSFPCPFFHTAKMAMQDLLKADNIKKALDTFKAADSFDHKKFFELVGLTAMSAEDVKKVFRVLDVDASGFIEEDELKFVLKGFSKDGRDLTDKETKAFLTAADKDGDGKIGIDEFQAIVHQ
ncbi:hypothetical protein AMELA_G00001360 [Ameiurus melas]|uniref:Parvalbumin n=2 Tax=Ictaluridae TaxID=7996 RepID=A0A7J6BE42_AMEME|nr:hypothetical protein AMELA_G00001360 [Ameiurus melas]